MNLKKTETYKTMKNLSKTTIAAVCLISLLVAGCGDANHNQTRKPLTAKQRIERDALASIVVVTLPSGLRCAVHDEYSTAGTGMSCDWSTWRGN